MCVNHIKLPLTGICIQSDSTCTLSRVVFFLFFLPANHLSFWIKLGFCTVLCKNLTRKTEKKKKHVTKLWINLLKLHFTQTSLRKDCNWCWKSEIRVSQRHHGGFLAPSFSIFPHYISFCPEEKLWRLFTSWEGNYQLFCSDDTIKGKFGTMKGSFCFGF